MGTIPTPPTFTAGAVLTAANLNTLRDVHNFWAAPPQCSAYRSTTQTIADNTVTAIGLNSELFDIVQSGDSPSHDNTTNNSRIVCRTAGKYEMAGALRWVGATGGIREARIRLNGTTDLVKANAPSPTSSSSSDCATTVIVRSLAVGDYIELTGIQTSGGNLDIVGSSDVTFLRMRLVAQ